MDGQAYRIAGPEHLLHHYRRSTPHLPHPSKLQDTLEVFFTASCPFSSLMSVSELVSLFPERIFVFDSGPDAESIISSSRHAAFAIWTKRTLQTTRYPDWTNKRAYLLTKPVLFRYQMSQSSTQNLYSKV